MGSIIGAKCGALHVRLTLGEGARLREDVYKRHISGDPIACRLPYAMVTKMTMLLGWKRFEMNDTLKFSGTSEEPPPPLGSRGARRGNRLDRRGYCRRSIRLHLHAHVS